MGKHTVIPFDVGAAVAYARKWALERNPKYVDFEDMGGDCSNFISQILIAGGGVMNISREDGWYFHSLSDRSYSWSSVPFLHDFLVSNRGRGPFGHEIPLSEVRPGDIIQLLFADKPDYSHSLFVLSAGEPPAPENILIAAHTYDSLDRPLDTYSYVSARAVRIEGVRV